MSESEIYSVDVLQRHPGFAPSPPSAELRARVDAASWPDGLLDRVLALRRDHDEIEAWLDMGWPTPDMLDPWVSMQELLLKSTLSIRLATWEDSPLLVEVCAESPEKVGDWSVTVERGPNPYAQFRLQERPHVSVLEDQRVGIGMAASSIRNALVAGEKTSVHFLSGWRIREGFRGMGFSHLLQNAAGPGTAWMGLINCWTSRLGNSSASWLEKVEDDFADRPGEFGLETDRLTSSVLTLDKPSEGRRSEKVRPATEADIPRCLDLINRSHAGLDMFRPYTRDYLDERLCDPSWGPKPSFYPAVYGWPDFRVLEIDGDVVACGGLWNRGRDVREVWRRDNEEFTLDPAALMDYGFASGREASMVELISHLLAEADQLGRSGLTAWVEYQPEVADLLSEFSMQIETRLLHVMPFTLPDQEVQAEVKRPYMDLAYW